MNYYSVYAIEKDGTRRLVGWNVGERVAEYFRTMWPDAYEVVKQEGRILNGKPGL